MNKSIITIIIALALTIGVQAQNDSIDQAQFMAVYDYQCRTLDDEGKPVIDSMEIVVQVGRTMTKSMPLLRSMSVLALLQNPRSIQKPRIGIFSASK